MRGAHSKGVGGSWGGGHYHQGSLERGISLSPELVRKKKLSPRLTREGIAIAGVYKRGKAIVRARKERVTIAGAPIEVEEVIT